MESLLCFQFPWQQLVVSIHQAVHSDHPNNDILYIFNYSSFYLLGDRNQLDDDNDNGKRGLS